MRHIRQQLIDLLEQARVQHHMDALAPRLSAALLHDFSALLPQAKSKRVAMCSRTVSHGRLHRHIITIRCPDQAFYLDAIKGYLQRQGIQPIGQQTMVARLSCDADSCELELRKPDCHDENNFMFVALHISATLTPNRQAMHRDMQAVLKAVDLSVHDFLPMQRQLHACAQALQPDDAEAAALLYWMNDNRYLLFGMQSTAKRLGLLRNKQVFERIAPGLATQIKQFGTTDKAGVTWLSLTASQHYLYSSASVEVVRICWHDAQQQLQHTILVGHFSRAARFTNCSEIPLLQQRWQQLEQAPLLQHSAFYRREIRTLFNRIPNRFLLSTNGEAWLSALKCIIDLSNPLQAITKHLTGKVGNLDWLLISVAADRFGPLIQKRILQAINEHALHTHGHESFGIGSHRILLVGITKPEQSIDIEILNTAIEQCIVFWKDKAKAHVLAHGERLHIPNALKELEQVPELYQQIFAPEQFLQDILMRQQVLQSQRVHVRVRQRKASIELYIYAAQQLSLGDLVDRVRAFAIEPVQEAAVPFGSHQHEESPATCNCMYISRLSCHSKQAMDTQALQRLQYALNQVLNDEADHDMLNALVITAGLGIDAITVLLTLRNHLMQLVPDAAILPLSRMLLRYPDVSRKLYDLFAARHDAQPIQQRTEAESAFNAAMEHIENLSDDRWFRALAALIRASLRSNAYTRSVGMPLAIKVDTQQLSDAPQPRPYREIFMHGVHMEGVHLRAGPIARGGIRYSDRPADFRTEVLELMRTQTVKNGQIVPIGAKGGFVIHADKAQKNADFILQQYRIFIRTLLSLTDNLIHGEALPPAGIHIPSNDTGDTYLVVAADKGTARFSDDANEEARLAGFWLDDAFASGGKHGYDHKVVGITARGAWVCTAHHFSRLGIDAWQDSLSCVAIGDMGGDVFGNGMLLNPNLKLLAAFNHQHIFIDPNPNVTAAFAERKRLFVAAKGWGDYQASCISNGGGVFARTAKSIKLPDSIRKALAIEQKTLSGAALIQAILKAPVDLLYNGGIGTYIKASTENHAEVLDPANNSVRIDAQDLRCKVICEGGNLGLTQPARIEYALQGGIINTDATDNAAGVDMSDHEVNLKILFASIPQHYSLTQRNRVLQRLTEQVTEQCLNNNLMQSRVITLAEYEATHYPPRLQRLRDMLQRNGWLDEAVAPRINENALLGLRPQLSILLGQEKNRMHAALVEQGFDTHSLFGESLLLQYFPSRLHRHFGKQAAAYFSNHALRSEIICTEASNYVVNHIGLTAVHHLETLLDASTAEIVEALQIADCLLDAADLRHAIWQQVDDVAQAVILQQQVQLTLMHFAEELLRLCSVPALTADWLQGMHKRLRHFRRSMAVQGISGDEGSRYLLLLKDAAAAGLDKQAAAHLAAMPELAQVACAVHLSSNYPLRRCLKANQASLHLLPIEKMETQLRSPAWGSNDAHNLRREWLHRLTLLKCKATEQLLGQAGNQLLQRGQRLWHEHKFWPSIEAFMTSELANENDEAAHLRLLLALTRLEMIVKEALIHS